ncbi:uncharacterized protein LOC131182976 [Hevea brasiliensis]|uniref:uncharacterized protein LOC131182976 n=1 Tax=Hevea brasiliensis TaxID=3981 RepID=UPI0025CD390F|nr:uncharacterized protein LOC131182976 [Hevea brasiliensis]
MEVDLSKEKKFSNPIPIKEIFKADDGRKRSKKEEKKQEEETEIELESESESNSEIESDIPISKLKERISKIDEGESSKKKEKMKLKMSDFVKISKANLDMMKEIKEMSGLTLSILEKSHELQKGIMAEQNAKMDMLINRLDRQEWFMKKMAQMLFGESFGKQNCSRQEEEKEDADKQKEEQSQDPSSAQPNPVPTASQTVPESTISLPMQYSPRRTKAQARKSVLPIPPKIQVTIPEKEPPRKKKQAKLVDPTHLRRSDRILSNKDKP